MSHRPERLGEAIKKEISDLIINELKDPRVGFASVTSVEVSNDLGYAKVFISVLGSPEEQEATMQGLQRAQGFIRREISRRIRMRHVPELTFKLDQSINHGVKIMKLLEDVREKEERPNE
ncbi:30S ribosome-binding factor RbfA [Desulfolucanica intricata]|uniref:30S ribosome-binding factor RbfA n=1 Tax=Desulfolucanica intricata TaxID=1285191 RepID=UPI0008316AF3|nr:30S ribosome-binding factor RbfA [Desulfolucanica intricata]